MIKCLIFGCLWVVTFVVRAQDVEPIQIGNESNWSLGHHLVLFKTTARLTPAQAFSAARTAPTTLLTERHLNLGLESNYVWLYFRVQNSAVAQTVVFLFDRIDIHRVQCFRQRNGQIDTLALTGDALPFQSRPIKVNYFAIPISLKAGEQSEIIILLDKRNEFISGNVRLYSPEKFLQAVRLDSALVAFFLGVAAFIFLFNFMLWLSLKDSVHLYFMAHLTSTVLYVLSSLGYGFEFIWPELLFSNSLIMTMLSALWASTNLFFMKRFLGLNPSTSRYTQATNGLAWYILIISFVGCTIALFQEQDLPVYILQLGEFLLVTWIIANAVLLVSIFTEQIRKQNEAAYIYVTALSFTLLGTLIYTLTLMNVLNAGQFTINWLLPGFLLEQIILAFGLTIRYNRFRQQNLNLQLTLAQERNQTTTQVINAQEAERKRLAADLHDDLGATLATIKGQLETLPDPQPELARPIGLMKRAITDLRHIAHNLMPPEFVNMGLTEALRETVRRAEAGSAIQFLFIDHGQQRRLDNDTELTIYRIAIELINNAIKHAKARSITVQLIFYPDYVSLLVEDDGQGYVVERPANPVGIGLRTIRSRVTWLKSTLLVDSGERGTTITLDVPL